MLSRRTVLVVGAAGLVSCASQSPKIPSHDQLQTVDLSLGSGAWGYLIVARDISVADSARNVSLQIQGRDLGPLVPGDSVRYRLAPGRVLLLFTETLVSRYEPVQPGSMPTPKTTPLDPFTNFRPTSMDVEIVAGATAIVRLGYAETVGLKVWRSLD